MEVYDNKNAKPEVIGEDFVFKYDYTLDIYKATITLEDKIISVSLSPSYDTNDISESLNTFKKIKNDFKNFYQDILTKCSKKMVPLANVWNEENPEHIITAEEIYSRIDKTNIVLDITLKDYTLFLEDDDIFLGHSIMCDGNIETGEFECTLAG